ncbi:NAD-dependent epimerase/dehydratase family protein [Devosia sp.]|uniref:NAD-dependent epimerase/dehydratase family protein n=1 Tax=Devosia sp. TaxID=1871048 RepID=UPI003A913CEE
MKIAVTGGRGGVGSAIVTQALAQGHSLVSIDRVAPAEDAPVRDKVHSVVAEMADYDALVTAFAGCDAMIHMAAIPAPGRHPDHVVHNNNVVGSYNALRAATENGIMNICQASSVNAIGHAFSREPRYDYFPIDENHPNYSEEPYSLSKWICEQQADAFARRYEDIRISSMRFHWVVPEREMAASRFNIAPQVAHHLWAYTRFDAAAAACLASLTADFKGHEVFYIVAPDSTMEGPSRELAEKHFPNVEIRGSFAGNHAFFSSAKAERMLGWKHPSADEV